jgi:hypothetical protein
MTEREWAAAEDAEILKIVKREYARSDEEAASMLKDKIKRASRSEIASRVRKVRFGYLDDLQMRTRACAERRLSSCSLSKLSEFIDTHGQTTIIKFYSKEAAIRAAMMIWSKLAREKRR